MEELRTAAGRFLRPETPLGLIPGPFVLAHFDIDCNNWEMHVRLLARLAANNLSEVIASYALGLSGRAKIRPCEVGHSIPPRTAEIRLPYFDDRCSLQAYTIGDRSYDETMRVICQMIDHTTPGTGAHGFAPDLGDVHGELIEEGDEQVIAAKTGKQAMDHFAKLSDQEGMEADPYTALYEQESIWITELGEKLGFSSDVAMARLNAWLFAPLDSLA
jgi:hypothetical protein